MMYSSWKPPADIYYSGNHWLVKVELAGISPDDVDIVVRNNLLSISGRRRDLHVRKGFICHALEISYSNFSRSIAFPAAIVPDTLIWDYRDGILDIQFHTAGR